MSTSRNVAPRAPRSALLSLMIGHALALPLAAWAGQSDDGVGQAAPASGSAAVPVAAAGAAADLDAVVVTGSRIFRQDYVASSPIATVGRDTFENTGAVTVEAALNQLPQVGIGANQTNAAWGGTGRASLNLRGLGAHRNLVLLDGRRLQAADVLGAVDVNTLPTALIEDVEIISGGASAVYGSDAISGVVNFRLRRDFQGIELDGQYSAYAPGDGATRNLALTAGGNFAGDRGNAVLSLSHTDRDGVDYMSRAFFRRSQGGTDFRLPTGIYRPSINPPAQTAVDAVFGGYGVAPGRVPAGAVFGYNDDGSLFLASNGPLNYRGPDGLLLDTGTQLNNLNQFVQLQVPLERKTAFGRVRFELSDAVTAFGQFNAVNYDSWVGAEAGNDAFDVPVSNPFISADLRALLASRADPDAPFRLEKRFQSEAGPRTFERAFDVHQFVVGLEGRLPSIQGRWDVYASHGRTQLVETNGGAVVVSALHALLHAADGGASLCPGGYNPFGLSALSDGCRDFLVARPISRTEFEQDVVEANLQGRLFGLPAGDARFALGLGYRDDRYAYQPDRLLQQGDIVGVFRTGASRGSSHVYELYGETLLPLLVDRRFAGSLDLGLAFRRSQYEHAGGVDSYKLDLNWNIRGPLGARASYQRAVRAPSVGELFVAPSVSIPSIGTVAGGSGDLCHAASQPRTGTDAAAVRALCLAQGVPAGLVDGFDNLQNEVLATSAGNIGLAPETADTYTVGLTWNATSDDPRWSGLSASADYYDIRIEDVVGTIGATQIIARCFNQDGASNGGFAADNFNCRQISRDAATGLIANVALPTLNLGSLRTSGVDLQFDWRLALDELGPLRGRLAFGAIATWVQRHEQQLDKGGVVYDYAGTVGTLPEWSAVVHADYALGPGTAGLRWRYIDAQRHASTATNPASTTPGVGAYHYLDLHGSWRLNDSISLRAGINNAADKAPPQVGGSAGATNASVYDIYGRQYFVAVNARF